MLRMDILQDPSNQCGKAWKVWRPSRVGLRIAEIRAYQAEKVSRRDKTEKCCSAKASALKDQAARLRIQYDDLTSQFRGFPTKATPSRSQQPNDPYLSADFARAKDTRPRAPTSSSFLKRSGANSPNQSKSVRFTDNPRSATTDEQYDSNRAALFPYRDEPEGGPPDHGQLDNQQIHEYHKNVIQEQDEQLDRLGVSIGRQRELSIQIGDELDDHIQMLDDVEQHMDRHQTTLDGARKRLGKFMRKAKENTQLTVILILICVLVLLIVILK